MRQDGKRSGTYQGRSFLFPLLCLLMVCFVGTSGALGFVLGRNAARGTGELIDTIVLSPGENMSGAGDEITHFLSGRVLYADGSPCAGATVEMKGAGKSDRTDEKGKFFFSDVRTGEHTLRVLDEGGALLADTPVSLNFQKGSDVHTEVTVSGVPSFLVPDDTRMLELTFTVDQEENRLKLQEKTGYIVTTDGEVVEFSGSMLRMESGNFSVMPGGDIVTSSGHVVLPSKSVVITPQDRAPASRLEQEGELLPGVIPQDNGSVALGNGVSVEPGGVVVLPDREETLGPSDTIILVGDGEAQELPKLPEEYQPAPEGNGPSGEETASAPGVEPDTAEKDNNGTVPSQTQIPDEGEKDDEPSEEPDSEPDPTPTATPEPTPEPTPDPLEISDLATGASWTQQSLVDLFKNKTSGGELGEEDGVPVIAPGSSGYYEFKLKNDADYNIRFTLSISEQSFHLPILYSVRDLASNYLYEGGGKVGTDGSAIVTDYILLPAKTEGRYRLGWEWQHEDWLSPWEDDVYDTSAAFSEDRTYIVSMSVDAEQVYSSATGKGDGTKYPGWTKF